MKVSYSLVFPTVIIVVNWKWNQDNHIYYGKPTYVKYEIVAAKRKKNHIHTHGGVQKNKISNRLITEKTELSHFFAALRYFFYSEWKSIIENFIHWDEKHLKRFAISRCWRWKKNFFNAALLLRVPAPPYESAGVYIDHFLCS